MSRPRKKSKAPEDLSGLAGWMYSDLILGLMVIFLATISFVPQFYGTLVSSSQQPSSNAPTYQYSKYYDEVMIKVYDSADPKQIREDIELFLNQYGLPTKSVVVSAQIVGAYNPENEQASEAILRALEFNRAVDAIDPGLFANASTTVSSSKSIETSKVALRLTFVAEIDVQK